MTKKQNKHAVCSKQLQPPLGGCFFSEKCKKVVRTFGHVVCYNERERTVDILIRTYILAIAAWCLAALLCYLPWRLLYLKRKGTPVSVLREVCLALLVCYTVGFLSQTIFPEIQLYNYNNENPTRLYIRNTSSTSFDKAADCKKVAVLFKDVAKILETPTIQNEIVDIWKNIIADIENIKERRQTLSEQYEKEVCTIAYQQLRTFAKDVLDFDLPETM